MANVDDPKIKTISEAYSMQPVVLTVDEKLKEKKENNCEVAFERYAKGKIHTIKISDDRTRINGYDYWGNILFSYLADSVNVHFYDN
jgi:imidazole glycerol phosphate synthase subunit HisF